jgi:hypothetical protein
MVSEPCFATPGPQRLANPRKLRNHSLGYSQPILSRLTFSMRPICSALAENKLALRAYRDQSRRDG